MLRLKVVGPIAATCGTTLVIATMACSAAVAADRLPPIAKAPAPADSGSLWAEIDYLAWTVKGDKLPALVTTSPAGTPLGLAGVLGAPGTTVLFGNATVNDGWRSGGRLQGGYWFDGGHTRGIEGSFFGLENASTGFAANSGANPILARPFFDAVALQQSAQFVAFPGFTSGSVTASESSRLLGADAHYRQDVGSWGGEHVNALIGYRYLHSSDQLGISSTTTVTAAFGLPVGAVIGASDSFSATSNFHGLDLGLVGEFTQGPWSLEWRASVALGANFNDAQINGSNSITVGGVTTVSSGGLLALSSNIGEYAQTRFAVVPELALKAGYQLTPHWRLVAGYDLLYWTGVQRAGNLVDTTVNPNLIPPPTGGGGPQRPQALLNTSPLLAQGFTLGLRYGF